MCTLRCSSLSGFCITCLFMEYFVFYLSYLLFNWKCPSQICTQNCLSMSNTCIYLRNITFRICMHIQLQPHFWQTKRVFILHIAIGIKSGFMDNDDYQFEEHDLMTISNQNSKSIGKKTQQVWILFFALFCFLIILLAFFLGTLNSLETF